MKKKMLIAGIIVVLVCAVAMSGCSTRPGKNATESSSGPGTSTGTGASAAKDKVDVVVSGDTITITGVKSNKIPRQNSTYFQLVQGTYLATYESAGKLSSQIEKDDMNDSTGRWIVASGYGTGKGSTAIPVGHPSVPAGMYLHSVYYGNDYVVTITKPTTGEPVPYTMTGSKSQCIAKAVTLSPGNVKISARLDAASGKQILINLYRVSDGETIDFVAVQKGTTTGETTKAIKEAGVYVLDADFPDNTGGEVTISQF